LAARSPVRNSATRTDSALIAVSPSVYRSEAARHHASSAVPTAPQRWRAYQPGQSAIPVTIHDRHISTIQNHAGRLGEQARSRFENAKVSRSSWELIMKRRNFLAAVGGAVVCFGPTGSAAAARWRVDLQHARP